MARKPRVERERRAVHEAVEFREDGKGIGTISGYAAVTNTETVIDLGVMSFRERIAPGAFKEAIRSDDVRALFNHDSNLVLGRNKNGTLSLSEDERGLRYEVTPPDTGTARDVMALIKRGDVDGSSFAFTVSEGGDEWSDEDSDVPLRTITALKLYDVSPVTYPAYEATSVSARSKERLEELLEQIEVRRAERAKVAAIAAREELRERLDRAWPSQ